MSVPRVCALLLAVASWSQAEGLVSGPAAIRSDSATVRGSIVYQHYCANCHGAEGDGRGRAARLYNPKPADLQESRADDAYKQLIIRKGGAHVGRSEFMPPWEQELTPSERDDVVTYLRSILK